MNIGDLLLSLIADGSKLTPQVEKEAQKAGDAGAKTLNQRMTAGLKSGGKVLGATFAAASAAATAGALQMEDAVARIRSETGASQAEAEQIAKSANRIAGDQQQALGAVTDVAIAVHKDMGLVGDQLDKVTEQTVKYARVTKQDGVGAVKALDDIGDAWNLTADQMLAVQGKLLVSNQKWGGSITDNQAALATMAPQLKALGASLDDGVSLLNLFAASGLDSSKAVGALNFAVKKLQPGQSLNDLIKQVSSIEDPTLRAKKAIELFGAKGGVALANVLKPGVTSLDQFGVSADDAATAVDASVDALDSTLTGRLKKVISQAKATLRGFGADFGPAVTGIASLASLASTLGLKVPLGPLKALGSRLGGAIASGIGSAIVGDVGGQVIGDSVAQGVEGAAKSGRLSTASQALGKVMGTTAGRALGTALSAAASAAIVAAPIVITYLLVQQGETDAKNQQDAIQPIIDKIQKEGEDQAKLVADIAQLQQKANLQKGNTEGVGGFIMGLFGDPAKEKALYDQTLAQLDQLKAALAASKDKARDMRDSFAAAGAATPKVAGAAASIGDTLADQMKSHGKAWVVASHALAMRAMGAVAQGINDARAKPLDAMSQLIEMMKHPLSTMGEVAKLFGQLAGDQLRKGLHSKDPAIRAQAQYTKQLIIDRLTELDHQTGPLGKRAAEEVRKGLKSKDPDVRAAAQRLANRLPEAIRNRTPAAATAARNMGATAARNLKAGFGTPTVTLTIKSVFDERGGHRAVGGPVVAGTPYWVNEHTANSEMFVPSTSGRVLTHAQATQALQGAGGGDTYAITVNAGRDVSPQRARLFGQLVADEVGHTLRRQRVRTTGGL